MQRFVIRGDENIAIASRGEQRRRGDMVEA
jgi:hypothetical protein